MLRKRRHSTPGTAVTPHHAEAGSDGTSGRAEPEVVSSLPNKVNFSLSQERVAESPQIATLPDKVEFEHNLAAEDGLFRLSPVTTNSVREIARRKGWTGQQVIDSAVAVLEFLIEVKGDGLEPGLR